ncbi:MAG: DUF1501 domain-containing protein [Planctomycetes bacterium]|nr:DUF1501 domain-containing protein [Planctomycetota bacterium]
MFQVGGFSSRDCHGLRRRSFLQAAFAAPFALGMTGRNFADDSQPNGKAKSVILLWLWGGPSHIDTFDPKPSAPMEIRGPFSTIATRTPGPFQRTVSAISVSQSSVFRRSLQHESDVRPPYCGVNRLDRR